MYGSFYLVQEWHNITVPAILQELMWRKAGDGERRDGPQHGVGGQLMVQQVVGGQQQVVGGQQQVVEASGEKLQEDVVMDREEDSPPSTTTSFNPSLVVQGGSGKIKKFLHIDESITGNLITIKGQNLLVLPARINTEMPADNTMCDQDEIMGSIEDLENPRNQNKIKISEMTKKINVVDMKKKAKTHGRTSTLVHCSFCGQTFKWQGNLNRHMRKAHNPIKKKELNIVRELQKVGSVRKGPLECQEVGCDEGFKIRENLMAHKRKKHGAPWLQCSIQGCDMKFIWSQSFRRHRKKHHKI